MLQKEAPDLVSIAPRHPDCHREMALAAIESGASIYIEKPMTALLDEADDIVEAAKRKRVKIGVGHTRRFSPEFLRMKALLHDGFIGTVMEMRVQGKQDARAGGEDLIVLGTHDFDLMRFYFGDPAWCEASVTVQGRDITRADVRQGAEPIWVAGDTVRAMFSFPRQVQCYWSSMKTSDEWNRSSPGREKWSFTIHGTKRILAYQSGFGAVYLDSPFFAHKDDTARWRDLPDMAGSVPDGSGLSPIADLIRAIETDTDPTCSGVDGRWAVEMVSAVYASQKKRGRIEFPLQDRKDPLLSF
jgi:predicted dehydrogenase